MNHLRKHLGKTQQVALNGKLNKTENLNLLNPTSGQIYVSISIHYSIVAAQERAATGSHNGRIVRDRRIQLR